MKVKLGRHHLPSRLVSGASGFFCASDRKKARYDETDVCGEPGAVGGRTHAAASRVITSSLTQRSVCFVDPGQPESSRGRGLT